MQHTVATAFGVGDYLLGQALAVLHSILIYIW